MSTNIQKFLLLILSLLFSHTTFSQAPLTVHFNYRSAEILPVEKEKIKQFLAVFSNKEIVLKLGGHTSNASANEVANRHLSLKRSEVVANYLKSISDKIIVDSVIGFGGTMPLIADISGQGKSINRRVEISLINLLEPVADDAISDADSETGKAKLKSLYDQLATSPEIFCVSPYRDTILAGKRGTII